MAGLTLPAKRRPRFDGGLLPVVVQSAADGEVLMLAWANEQALETTARTGDAHFWSRSRESLWRKGETSGNVLRVEEIAVDCDGDALLYRVAAAGPACHTGARSCFVTEEDVARPRHDGPGFTLESLERIIAGRAAAPADESYTARLLADGPRAPAAKVVEEAGEVALAAVAQDETDVADEAADLLYHLLVLLRSRDVALAAVIERLAARRR